MTKNQTEEIIRLQREGKGYKTIAAALGVPLSSVKSWCKRHSDELEQTGFCLQCGARVRILPHKKRRRFCSDKCRLAWWRNHPENRKDTTGYKHICRFCGKEFTNDRIKADYCSRLCFANARRKGGGNG